MEIYFLFLATTQRQPCDKSAVCLRNIYAMLFGADSKLSQAVWDGLKSPSSVTFCKQERLLGNMAHFYNDYLCLRLKRQML